MVERLYNAYWERESARNGRFTPAKTFSFLTFSTVMVHRVIRVLDIRPIQLLRSSPIKFRSFDPDPLPSSCNFIIIIIIVGEASIPNFYFR